MEAFTSGNQQFFEIIEIHEVGEGMRVCIDFIDILDEKEGIFVGNTGSGYVHVLSENRQSENYPPRPFRINAGSFHQYLYQPEKTLYVHEVNPADVLIVTDAEREREISVGRVKMEKRPFIRIVCKTEDGLISATLQQSSSVHVVEENKGEVSILEVKPGDKIRCIQDTPGRHLGEQIDEWIVEK
ncbi:3-dehydroquinate synthase II [Virgibacillus ainsalahensis]